MKTEKISVKGMHCASCEILVNEALQELDGVKKSSSSWKKGIVEVSYDDKKTTLGKIKDTIKKEGYDPK